MSTKFIKKWLSEFKGLSNSDRVSYASTVRQDDQLIDELYDLFLNNADVSHEIIVPVCHQMFDFYRSLINDLQLFTLEFVPTLVWTYLTALANIDKQKYGGIEAIEACLLGIYNLDTVNELGQPNVKSSTIPSLARGSIFHEPPSLSSLLLTESALMNCQSGAPVTVTTGPLPQVDSIISQNRPMLLTYAISRYNANITFLSPRSRKTLCKLCTKLAKSGFNDVDDFGSSMGRRPAQRSVSFTESVRIPLASNFLVELLSGVYYAMYNGQARDAMKAVDGINARAAYDLLPDVLLVTNAIRSSLQFNSGQPKDGPMGISVALSPAQFNPAFSKDAITNASFRAKRLPEDIEVLEVTSQLDTSMHDESMESDSGLHRGIDLEKAKSSPAMRIGKGPLKSIMKKEKAAKQRKESESSGNITSAAKKGSNFKTDTHASKSPRHSTSASSGLVAPSNNGEAIELETVQFKLASHTDGGSNRMQFEPIEFRPKSASAARNVVSNGGTSVADKTFVHGKPLLQPASHSREQPTASNGKVPDEQSDQELVFTQL